MTFLESRGLDLDAVLEVDPSDDVSEELVSIAYFLLSPSTAFSHISEKTGEWIASPSGACGRVLL
jgi:hypothetical protein